MKFKILPKVDGFRLKGVMYKPGDVVDLPESYAGESWLQRVEPEAAEITFPAELESTAKVEEERRLRLSRTQSESTEKSQSHS